jgi:hypothetical protein
VFPIPPDIISKPKRLSTGLGLAGAVAQANKEKQDIPSSRLELPQKLFAQVMRGGHW